MNKVIFEILTCQKKKKSHQIESFLGGLHGVSEMYEKNGSFFFSKFQMGTTYIMLQQQQVEIMK